MLTFVWNRFHYCGTKLCFGIKYNGVSYDGLKLSVNDIIVSQKGSNGDGKPQFYGQDYNVNAFVKYDGTLC